MASIRYSNDAFADTLRMIETSSSESEDEDTEPESNFADQVRVISCEDSSRTGWFKKNQKVFGDEGSFYHSGDDAGKLLYLSLCKTILLFYCIENLYFVNVQLF